MSVVSQRVTEVDLANGRIRLPHEAKALFPAERAYVSMSAKGLREGPRMIVASADRIGRDLSHGIRALVVSEQVIGDARRPRDRQATQPDPLAILQLPLMQPDVRTSRLPSHTKREVVSIGRQVADPIQGCGRPMRDHSVLGPTLPDRGIRREP